MDEDKRIGGWRGGDQDGANLGRSSAVGGWDRRDQERRREKQAGEPRKETHVYGGSSRRFEVVSLQASTAIQPIDA